MQHCLSVFFRVFFKKYKKALADVPQDCEQMLLEQLLQKHDDEPRVILAAIYEVQNPQKNGRFACQEVGFTLEQAKRNQRTAGRLAERLRDRTDSFLQSLKARAQERLNFSAEVSTASASPSAPPYQAGSSSPTRGSPPAPAPAPAAIEVGTDRERGGQDDDDGVEEVDVEGVK